MASILHTSGLVWVWNSIHGSVDSDGNPASAVQRGEGHVLEDGDVVLASYPLGTPPESDAFYISYDDGAGTESTYAVTYSIDTSVPLPDPPTDSNPFPNGAYLDTTDPNNPCEVEVDPAAYENFEQYYDENDTPTYEVSDCNGSIGIRG